MGNFWGRGYPLLVAFMLKNYTENVNETKIKNVSLKRIHLFPGKVILLNCILSVVLLEIFLR